MSATLRNVDCFRRNTMEYRPDILSEIMTGKELEEDQCVKLVTELVDVVNIKNDKMTLLSLLQRYVIIHLC